ncbi:MAG: MASE3 domain-containing protein [Patescibacteria group bacterium]|jgi:PAS domain S-box-containing protein
MGKITGLKKNLAVSKKFISSLVLVLVISGIYLASFYNYLLFHSLAELVSITIALAIFIIVWNSRDFGDNSYFLVIGVALFFIAIIDSFHLFAFKGMNVIGQGADLATQLWLSARYLASVSFFIAPFFINKKPKIEAIFGAYFIATAFIFLSIFYWKIFPVAYGADGLTPFKKISEYIISAFYFGSIITLYAKRASFDASVLVLIYASLVMRVAAELCFTLYVGVYDIFNLLGHLLRIVALYLNYLGIVEIALSKPYRVLFKNLKDSEVAARINEERYRSIVELSPEAIFVHREGEFLYFNPACMELFGADSEHEIKNKKTWELIAPDSRDKFLRIHRENLFKEDAVSVGELKAVDLNGKEKEVEVREKRIFYQGVPAIQTIMIDISERKAIEETLVNEKNKLTRVLDSMEDGAYIINESFEFEYVNPALKKIFGSPEGKKCHKYFYGREEKCPWCKMDEIMGGKVVRWELFNERVGRDFDFIDNPVKNGDGKISKLTILRDVTDNKRMEKLLRESERRYRTIFENTGSATLLINDDGVIALVNSRLAGLSGYDKEEIEGKMEWNKFVDAGDFDRLEEYRRLRLLNPVSAPKNYEFRLKTKDNRIRFVYANVERMPEIKMTIVALIDVTEKKEIEDALKKAHDNLERLVKERTAELVAANDKLKIEVFAREGAEKQLAIRNTILGFFSQAENRKEYLDLITGYLKKMLGCRYLGIRVIDEERKIPYESYSGFSEEFFKSENMLSLDKDDCVCIRIAAGKPEPVDTPYLTRHGSFYSGDTLKLSGSLNEEEKKCFRGTCIKSGFLSVAVIPIIDEGKVVGAIHLADKEKDKFSREQIGLLEQLNLLIGEGIVKFNLSDEIRKMNEELEKRVQERTSDLKKFQQAVQNASDLIVITDTEGKILFVNNAAEELTGYGLEDIIGQTPSLWGDELAEKFYSEAFNKIRESKAPLSGEVINYRKDGMKFIGELRISPVLSEDKNVIFFVGIMRDITEAKEIDKAKSEFISMASHQLRTPLTSIGLSVELLIRGIYDGLDDRYQGYLKEIHGSTRRMTELISALLNVSRIEMGTFAIKFEFLEITGLVSRILEELNEQFANKNLVLEKSYAPEPLEANFDPNIFRIIFENIATNAIRYTPAGGKITVGVGKKNNKIVISVKDTGYGIPPEDQEKIFLKSFRSEAAKKISSDGTGLGLYIARSVAERVGAGISVESAVGQGSTFYFTVPIG